MFEWNVLLDLSRGAATKTLSSVTGASASGTQLEHLDYDSMDDTW